MDVIFCMSLIHHLDIQKVRKEMLRILRPGGIVLVKEPIRFSRAYGFLRSFLPAHEDVSDGEHPLTEIELQDLQEGFESDGVRFFRLPFVPLLQRVAPGMSQIAFKLSDRLIESFPGFCHYATSVVLRLRKSQQFGQI